ncbi:hypothetical protein ACIQ9P_37270 [Kitasatospora sp. NPDC094019]|uniref:hypothetical protein n=1 Tax=Kitasatospora sp. NPDC094019 TaxID=3364091 RepID=UPI00380B0C57
MQRKRIALFLATTVGTALLAAGTMAPTASAQTTSTHAGTASTRAKGCVNADRWPFVVNNRTSGSAVVYDQPNCTGRVLGVVPAGQSRVFEFGRSAYFSQ